MAIPISEARINAFERVLYVMREKYAEEIFDLRDQNLYLPAPEDDAYFVVPNTDPQEITKNHAVACMTFPLSDRTTQAAEGRKRTSGPNGVKVLTTWNAGILIIFRKGLYDPASPVLLGSNQRPLTAKEADYLRAERYTTAMINVVRKYLVKKDLISKVDVIQDGGTLVPSDQEYFGIAEIHMQLTQDVAVPTSTFEI